MGAHGVRPHVHHGDRDAGRVPDGPRPEAPDRYPERGRSTDRLTTVPGRARSATRSRPPRPRAGVTTAGIGLSVPLAALGVVAGVAAGPGGGRPVSVLGWLALLAVLTAAGALRVPFRHREEDEALDLFVAALTPVVHALPGIGVVLVTAAASLLAQAVRRERPARAADDVARWMCAAGLAALLFSWLRPATAGGAVVLPPLIAAMTVVPLVHTIALVVARVAHGEPPRRTLAAATPTLRPALANWAANLCVGVLFTVTWSRAPAAAPLFLLPLGLAHLGGRALAAARVDRARLRGLHRATHALAVPVDPRNAIEPFLDEVRRCFTARAVDLVQVSGEVLVVDRVHAGAPPARRHEQADAGGLGSLLLVDRPRAVTASDGGPLARALRREGWRSCLVTPLRGRDGQVRGALAVHDRAGFRGDDGAELAVLGALAGELAGALDRGALLDAILAERGMLADIVNRTSDGIATIAQDGTVLSWNPGFERISGWTAAEMTGQRALDRLRARDSGGRLVALERWAEPGVRLPGEVEIVTRGGERRWLSCSTTEAPDTDGRPLLILTVRDVTGSYELRRAEQALADSETRFKALVRHSSDLLMVVDAQGTIRYASPACRRIAGEREVSWVGRSWFDIVHPDDATRVRRTFEARRQHGGVGAPVEFRIQAADGTVRHIEALPNNLLDDPAVRGMVLNARDVTDRKRADAMLASQVAVLDLIAHDAPLDDVLDELARSVETWADGARCVVVVAGTGEDGTPADPDQVAVAAAPSLAEHERSGPIATLWEAALRERAPVVVADTAGDPAWHAASPGTRAVWVAPVMSRDKTRVLGAIALLHDRPRSPSRPDWRRLELATHLADVAIEQTTARRKLAHMATHDVLTGLPNRLAFTERSAAALKRSRRTGERVAVLFLDLDRFKVVNDSFGHEAGDRLLVELAGRLERAVRPGDTLARFGGDEFTILCEGVSGVEEAEAIAERIRRVLAMPVQLPQGEVFVTGSIGIALAGGPGADGDTPGGDTPGGDTPGGDTPGGDTLVEDADAAMYLAKARGGDRHALFHEAMRAGAKQRLAIQNSLHRALERGEFRVVYQPTVSLLTGELLGVEALVRWLHPERGLLAPDEFIRAAEETGLIVPIGVQVLRQACQEAACWRASGPGGRPLPISVNLSARQFAHPDLAGVVAGILAETGTDPASLRLEITESVLMEDAESTNAALRELRDLGVRLSIDDFGTGYSSLSYLKRFPVDELKVDRSFVDGIGTDAEDTAIVAAVVNLAHTLDMRVVAEGVETEAQASWLRELGCDAAQGHWFGRAVPPELLGVRVSA